MSHLKEALVLSFTVNTPTVDTYELIYPSVTKFTLGANLANSEYWVESTGTNPTGPLTYTVWNETQASDIGDIIIGTGGAITFTTASGTAKIVEVGDVVTIKAPASLLTFNKSFGVSLVGER